MPAHAAEKGLHVKRHDRERGRIQPLVQVQHGRVAGDDRLLDVIHPRLLHAFRGHALELAVDASGEHVQPLALARLNARDDVRAKAALRVFREPFGEHRAACAVEQLHGDGRRADVHRDTVSALDVLEGRGLVPGDDLGIALGLERDSGIACQTAGAGQADARGEVVPAQQAPLRLIGWFHCSCDLYAALAAGVVACAGQRERGDSLPQQVADERASLGGYRAAVPAAHDGQFTHVGSPLQQFASSRCSRSRGCACTA